MFAAPTPPKPPAVTAAAGLQAARQNVRQVDSSALLGPGGELFIVHHDQVYRLRITAQGKLILTK